MHFLQTSDWHLGRLLFENSLLEDQKFVLNQIKEQIKLNEEQNTPYDALLIPGDIYDRANPPREAMAVLSDFLSDITKSFPNLHIFILAGNHDDPKLLYFAKQFFALGNVHICTDLSDLENPFILTKTNKTTDDSEQEIAAIYQIPYLEAFSFENLRRQQEMYEEACKKIKEHHLKNHSDKLCIVCAHLFTIKAQTGDAERACVGPAEEVDASLFADFDYTAVGHIHSFQPCGISKNMYYSGTPLKYNPDNKDRQEKFLLDVNLTKKADKNAEVEIKKLPLTPLHKITTITGSYADYYGPASKEELIKPFKDDYIVFICTDDVPPDSPVANLRTVFPYIRAFRMEDRLHNENQSDTEERRELIEQFDTKPDVLFDKFLEDINADVKDENLKQKEKELFLQFMKDLTKEM